ncbi:MAG: aldose 1-epimerase family protein, partial [Lachnospiraceae bacterium]|nr:aldose 1-epimerase family protein [Lachnospiraceae bacterium]
HKESTGKPVPPMPRGSKTKIKEMIMNYTIQNEYLTVTASDAGAELQSIKSADGTEYLWQADPAFWRDKAPNIFPYVARLTNGTFIYDGNSYNMKIHGLTKYLTLEAEILTQDSMAFRLTSSDQTKAQYPFDFVYQITYTLKGSCLVITTSVENTGNERMYFAIGGHPGFNVPLEEGLSFEDYYLEFDRPSHPYQVGFSDTCFLTGEDHLYPLEDDRRIPLRHDLFDNDAIVLKHAPKTVRIASDKGHRSVTVHYPDFMYIGFWHAVKKDAPYVCVEPWSALPSRDGIVEDLSCQSDLTGLDAGKVYTNTWTIEIQ